MPRDKEATVIKEIRRAIKESGRSWYSIAKESGIAETTVARLMHGTNAPTFAAAEQILNEIGLRLTIVPKESRK